MLGKKLTKAIILTGCRDFGRHILPSKLPTALWPVAGKSVLERLLTSLAEQDIKQATVCSNGDGSLLAESIKVDARMELEFLDEPLPVGTAGCIRNAASNKTDALLLVFPADRTVGRHLRMQSQYLGTYSKRMLF